MRHVARQEAKKAIKREIETKHLDGYVQEDVGVAQISSVGQNFQLTGSYSTGAFTSIVQGVGDGQYIGEMIRPALLKIRYEVIGAIAAPADTFNTMSIMIIQAKGNFILGASAANQYQVTGLLATIAPQSAVNDNFNDRYRVLARHIITVDGDDPAINGEFTIKSKKLRPIRFSDGAGTIEAGTLFMSVISDSLAPTHPALRAYWRLYYKDA